MTRRAHRIDPDTVADLAGGVLRQLQGTAPRPSAAAEGPVLALVEPPRSHPSPARRDYAAPREVIRTACGRVVTREYVDGYHRYQLWEPLIGPATYGETRSREGVTWGLARTRRPVVTLPAGEVARSVALMEHELRERRRAMDLIRATVFELGPAAGVRECVYESRGDIILFTDPQARVAARRRGVP